MSLPGYSKYKDSGVAWLGTIPAHWTTVQSRRYFSHRNEKARKTDKQLTASQKYGVLYQIDFMEREGQKVMQVVVGADILKHVEPNDFVISMRSFQGGIEWCDLRGSISSAYVILEPSESIHPPFYRYLLKSNLYVQALQATTNLVRDGQALRFSNFAQVSLPLLPIDEQSAIATFLDRETAKIDALIAEQEKLIALLEEKRQATISHAVTRGLNPDVPMKDSGVEWLGRVPAHWALPPLYLRYSCELGKMLNESRITGRHLVPYLRNVDVQWGRINHSDLPEMDIEPAEYDRYTVRSGDLLVCEGGEVGRAAVVEGGLGLMGYQKALHRLRTLSDDEAPRFMFYVFAWATKAGVFSGEGQSTIAHLTGEQLRRYRFPKPLLGEQQAIAQFLDAQSKKLGELRGEVEHAIGLLKERRSALITAAVTGQIDVRNAVDLSPEQLELVTA